MRRAGRMVAALVLALAATASVAHGQGGGPEEGGGAGASAERPRVGLVLSGGAAKGIAHVGVIRVLEEAGLPVDVVTGTSMGSIVGGLYAMGYTPEMMTRIMREQKWSALLTDANPRDVLDLERRLHSGETLLTIPTRGRAVALPSGVVQGQRVLELLTRLAWPHHEVTDFRKLPRPFAAVVMDLRTGEAVPLTSGSLPLAIRASMSIPSMFEPVVMDGRTYVDGGMARNLPAEDARALGADVLVCVDVGDPAPPEDGAFTAGSLINVVLRTAFLRSEASTREQRRLCDVVIEPEAGGLGFFAFDAADEWVLRGETAARAALPQIQALVELLGRPALPVIPAPVVHPVEVATLEIRGASAPGERLVRQRIAVQIPAPLTPEDLRAAVERVYSSGAFARVSYRLLPAEISAADASPPAQRLVIEVAERQDDALGFGLRYDSHERAALLFALSLRNRLAYGSSVRLAARLGQQTQLGLEAFDRLGADSPIGIGGALEFTDVPVDLFAGGDRPLVRGDLAVLRASGYTSYALATSAFVRLGLNLQRVRAKPRVGADTLGDVAVRTLTQTFASASLHLLADTRDRTAYPLRGYRASLLAEGAERAVGSGATFGHLAADAETFVPASPSLTLFGRLALTRGRGADLPPSHATFVGGLYPPALLPGRFLPLYGARPQELIGRSGQLLLTGTRWRPGADVFLELVANAGAVGDRWTLDPDAQRFGVGVTGGLFTPVGPVSLTLAGDRIGDLTLGFSLGARF